MLTLHRSPVTARIAGLILAALCSAAPAGAQLSLSAGFEYFGWSEHIANREVTERGPIAVLALEWFSPASHPLRFGGRSKVYAGAVDYTGTQLFAPDAEVLSTSRYLGAAQAVELRHRLSPSVDVVGGAGAELWRRRLGAQQNEDFTVATWRFGIGSPPARSGWSFDVGLQSPFWSRENAHLTDVGFDANPTLVPRGTLGGAGRLGYGFENGWIVAATLDELHFDASLPVRVTREGSRTTVVQPASDRRIVGLRVNRRF